MIYKAPKSQKESGRKRKNQSRLMMQRNEFSSSSSSSGQHFLQTYITDALDEIFAPSVRL